MPPSTSEFIKRWLPGIAPSDRERFQREFHDVTAAPENTIWITSLVSGRTGGPMVEIKIGPYAMQVEPDEARSIAQNLLEVAGGAEMDAALYEILTSTAGSSPEVAFAVIRGVRTWRDERRERLLSGRMLPQQGSTKQ